MRFLSLMLGCEDVAMCTKQSYKQESHTFVAFYPALVRGINSIISGVKRFNRNPSQRFQRSTNQLKLDNQKCVWGGAEIKRFESVYSWAYSCVPKCTCSHCTCRVVRDSRIWWPPSSRYPRAWLRQCFFVSEKVKLSLFLVKESEGIKKVKTYTFFDVQNTKYADKHPQNVV